MSRKQKKTLIRLLAGAALLTAAMCLTDWWQPAPLTGWWRPAVFLIPYLTVGYDVIIKALRNIWHGQVFDEQFLMSVATVGALAIGEYPEAVFVMLFYQVGELFQSYAVGKSRRSIADLMDIRPDTARLIVNGAPQTVDPSEVAVGDLFEVHPGEKIPLDGVVTEGDSSLSTVALTGESVPREVAAGDRVLSGCVNLTGVLRVRADQPFGESTAVKILELTENAASSKAKSERFITKFARRYTPAVVIAAVVLAVVPPLLLGGWSLWLRRALIFLVVSCPCALVISVPLTFFGGIGGASRKGILVKGAQYLETLSKVETVVFDKTGTLTKGVFEVVAVHPSRADADRILALAAAAEAFSSHPIALSLAAAAGNAALSPATDVREQAGRGVSALVDGVQVLVGNEALMESNGIACRPCHKTGTIVHVAADGDYLGHIVISDQIKPDAAEAVARLRRLGVSNTVLLTGDRQAAAEQVAGELGIDQVHARLLPDQKVAQVERLLAQPDRKGSLVFVGDGINDAPVLARADVGIAMGGVGSDAAIEAADVVLMNDQPTRVAQAVAIARRTLRIVRQNVVFALAVKLAVLVLAACGLAPMWLAVFADVGVTVLAVSNATRALKAE